MLYDGHAVYTPGESETRNGASAYYSNDRLGNLWTLDGTTKNQLTYEDFTGFGSVTAGSNGQTPFGYGGGNGCLTDADTGLVLMGHRYYDTRIGRFITQDPAGDGDNWYAYADNSPTNDTDPTGLFDATGMSSGAIYDAASYFGGAGSEWSVTDQNGKEIDHFIVSNPDMGIGTPGAGMGGEIIDAHTKGARASTEEVHQRGAARTAADTLKKEKGDITRAKKEALKKAEKTGVSTRDPDGSVRRAREATQQAELEQQEFDSRPARYGRGPVGSGGGGGGAGAGAAEEGAALEEGLTAEELLEIAIVVVVL